MHQNSAVKSITFQWIFGAFGFPEVDFQVFCVFWMVLVIILRISMDFKAFWTGPSLARVHLPMHFIVFLDIVKIFKVFADFLTVRRRPVGPGITVQNCSWGRNWLFPPLGNYGAKQFRGGLLL